MYEYDANIALEITNHSVEYGNISKFVVDWVERHANDNLTQFCNAASELSYGNQTRIVSARDFIAEINPTPGERKFVEFMDRFIEDVYESYEPIDDNYISKEEEETPNWRRWW